jgi:hypothetical protein
MIDLTLPMKPLQFDELVDLGRSAIPTLARGWTDHNIHDPGIMLMELVAWIAEAQMYSLARMRQDERRAFAHLLAIEPRGPKASAGLLWPKDGIAFPPGVVIKAASEAAGNLPDVPTFFTSHDVQLATAELVRIESRFADGISHDWTRVNAQQSATFMPFGDASSEPARLILTFQLSDSASPTSDAPVSLGFEVVNAAFSKSATRSGPKLLVSLWDANGERPLEVEDTTLGLLESGVLLLSTGHIAPDRGRFQLILKSVTGGFERPPRIRRIGINVLPIQQIESVNEESQKFGQLLPNQQYSLLEDELVFTAKGKDAVSVTTLETGGSASWTQTDDLQRSGPDDRHFELDPYQGTLTFGNGVNGRLVPAGATLQVQYKVCAGVKGNVQSDVIWKVKGVTASFINPEIISGGLDTTKLTDLRDSARIQVDSAKPLVTARDLETAAKSYTDLAVTRAVELPYDSNQPVGGRVLVVTGPRDDPGSPVFEEPADFLKAVRARILPRLPLGQRLRVIGPSYVQIGIKATLTSTRNSDPAAVRTKALDILSKRLATVTENGLDQWPLGRPVSAKTVQGWLRQVEGVALVQSVELRIVGDPQLQTIVKLKQRELPSLQISEADITVVRPAEGSVR